jgi:predicted  nucleic acid-binding Zn-ribbon protein
VHDSEHTTQRLCFVCYLEDLHAELSEINHVYTDNLNKLYVQIAALEKRIEDLQGERSLLQSETSSQSSVFVKEKDDLTREISRLQDDLSS